MYKRISLGVVVLLIVMAGMAGAAVPKYFNVQGKVTQDGAALKNTPIILSVGGKNFNDTTNDNGLFNTEIGPFDDPSLFNAIKVDFKVNGVIIGSQNLNSVPYAFKAAVAESLAGGGTGDIYVKKTGDAMKGALSISGDLTVALIAASTKEVHGIGVYGLSKGTGTDLSKSPDAGVVGLNFDKGPGLYGLSYKGMGVYASGETYGVQATGKTGVVGTGSNYGVAGLTPGGIGVSGFSFTGIGVHGGSLSGTGVRGAGAAAGGSFESTAGYGVYGKGQYGVYAQANKADGYGGYFAGYPANSTGNGLSVLGKSKLQGDATVTGEAIIYKNLAVNIGNTSPSPGYGITAYGTSAGIYGYGSGKGVYGVSTASDYGVYGKSKSNYGVFGHAAQGNITGGVYGKAETGDGVFGEGYTGIRGKALPFGTSKGLAGLFEGTVLIKGKLLGDKDSMPVTAVSLALPSTQAWADHALSLGDNESGWDVLINDDLVVRDKLTVQGEIYIPAEDKTNNAIGAILYDKAVAITINKTAGTVTKNTTGYGWFKILNDKVTANSIIMATIQDVGVTPPSVLTQTSFQHPMVDDIKTGEFKLYVPGQMKVAFLVINR